MPHDKNGEPLQAGDRVILECVIKNVCEGEFCTLDLETVEVMPGNGQKNQIGALNAKQVIKGVFVSLLFFLSASIANADSVTITRPDGTRIVIDERSSFQQRAKPQAAPPQSPPVTYQRVQVTEYVPQPVQATRYYAVPARSVPVASVPVGAVVAERPPPTPIRSAIRAFFGR